MTKFCFNIIVFSFLLHTVQAQSTKVYTSFYEIFSCKNSDGSIETLLATFDNNGGRSFIYKNSKNPNKEIPLKIVSNAQDETFIINFPNDNKPYILKTCMACPEITCTNPDGSEQTFNLDYTTWGNRGTYRCINADKSIEYLRIESPRNDMSQVILKYSSNKKKQWITLKTSNIIMAEMGRLVKIVGQFPNETQKYLIRESNGNSYICVNPNGTEQIFEWINK